MIIFEWTDDFSVGVTRLDNQHKKLVELINELFDAMAVGKGRDVLEEVIRELEKYIVIHFQSEERMMMINGFNGLEEHKQEHARFIGKIKEFKEKFKSGDRKLTIEVVDFLKEWIINHIQGMDKKYAAFFKEKGIGY
ncbi:MAG: bacteriohemerythrin [Bacteroidota bacterium]